MENKKAATVGVFMPAYNQGQYIDDALESLKRQTFQDFIVYIVDDGSNDGKTPKILKKIKYDKAVVQLNKSNRGVAYRARQCFKELKTDYVLVLCADDYLAPNFLEKTVQRMKENPRCGIVSTNIFIFSDYYETECKFDKKKMTLPYMLSKCYCLGSSLMRKQALDGVDFSGGFTRYQDWDRYVTMMENGWTADLIEEPLFYYRQHDDSLSQSTSIEIEMEVQKKMLKKHRVFYQKYYETVILDRQFRLLELQEGKDWLDKEYHRLNKEVEYLTTVLEIYREKNLYHKTKKIVRRIKRKLLK